MTANDIDAIRKLTNAATPGPWTPHTTYPHTVWQGSMYDEDPGMISTNLSQEVVADAEFIAAARTHVPALCDEIEQLRAELYAAVQANVAHVSEYERMRAERNAARREVEQLRAKLADLEAGVTAIAKPTEQISSVLCADGIHEADGSCCNTARSLDYIRSNYQVPAEIAGRVIANGRPGRIVGADGAYLLIRIDGEPNPLPYHPTWEMQYVATEAVAR